MERAAYLGCDVSKGYCDFLLLDSKETVLEPAFTLSDTKDGRANLRKLIEKWLSSGMNSLYCGVESTGGYENNWYRFLRALGKFTGEGGPVKSQGGQGRQ